MRTWKFSREMVWATILKQEHTKQTNERSGQFRLQPPKGRSLVSRQQKEIWLASLCQVAMQGPAVDLS